jgi:hypothetical protein
MSFRFQLHGTADCTKRVTPEFSPFHFFHFSMYGTKWVSTALTFLVQKRLGAMEKCGMEKTLGRHVSCNLL